MPNTPDRKILLPLTEIEAQQLAFAIDEANIAMKRREKKDGIYTGSLRMLLWDVRDRLMDLTGGDKLPEVKRG